MQFSTGWTLRPAESGTVDVAKGEGQIPVGSMGWETSPGPPALQDRH